MSWKGDRSRTCDDGFISDLKYAVLFSSRRCGSTGKWLVNCKSPSLLTEGILVTFHDMYSSHIATKHPPHALIGQRRSVALINKIPRQALLGTNVNKGCPTCWRNSLCPKLLYRIVKGICSLAGINLIASGEEILEKFLIKMSRNYWTIFITHRPVTRLV